MGTSFLTMNETVPENERQNLHDVYGFWAAETPMVAWFKSLAAVIRRRGDVPAWLAELRDHWESFDAHTGGGCVFDRSADYLTAADRKAVMLDFAAAAVQRLLDHGGDFHAAFPETLPECTCSECRAPPGLSDKAGIFEIAAIYTRLVQGMTGRHWPTMSIGYLAEMRMAQP